MQTSCSGQLISSWHNTCRSAVKIDELEVGIRWQRQRKKLIANNKKAYHDYFILEKYEAGLVLHGTEVKSLRMGKCSIKEAFIRVEDGGDVYLWYAYQSL